MKDLNLSELFCEVLSGAATFLLAVLFLDVVCVIELPELLRLLLPHVSLGAVTVAAFASYLMGLLVDSVGLAIGEWRVDALVASERDPTAEESKGYWTKVSEHAMKLREQQWAFYSLYRNLLILLFPALALLPIAVAKYRGCLWAITAEVGLVCLGLAMFFAARATLDMYRRVPRHYV